MAMNLTAGETLKIERCIEDATAASLRMGGPSAANTALTNASGNTWAANIATDSLPAGNYSLEILATFTDGTKAVVWRDALTIRRAPGVGEARSEARIALDNVNAMLRKTATEGVMRYRINNRELWRYSMADLKMLKADLVAEVRKEERLAKGRSSLGPNIAVYF